MELLKTSVSGINELVVRFANVNGTGSASANGIVAKSFFRMGLPIGPKNMFPSNIQGLPTWYEVRVSEAGWSGRRGGVDVMVAMNGQTFAEDVQSVSPGGYLVHDSTRAVPEALRRKDINWLPLPLTALARDAFANPRQRALLQNVVYVGALAAFLDIDAKVIHKLIEEQFVRSPKLVPPNIQALEMGVKYARENFGCPLPLRVARRELVADKILIDGNSAAALGAVFAGATVAAWYPITPSTSLVDAYAKYCAKFRVDPVTKKMRYSIVQAEDELAAIGMVLGASWNGARAFTATSGPGVSLMSEFLGFAYYAEVPVVLFNIQRCGPSTGMPTRTQQADLLSTAYASHGDTKHVMLFPATPEEAFNLGAQAFDLAERLQTPVVVMSDLDLGMNEWLTPALKWNDGFVHDRGKVLDAAALEKTEKFFRYVDNEGDGIGWRTLPGAHPSKGAYFTRGSGHDKFGRYTEDGAAYRENFDRLLKKFQRAVTLLPAPVVRKGGARSASVGVITMGTTDESMIEAQALLGKAGIQLDCLRVRAFPFQLEIADFVSERAQVFVVEQNRDGQLRAMLAMELGIPLAAMRPILHYDGMPITATFLVDAIRSGLGSPQSPDKNTRARS